jgi:DNA-binding NarL/FixJ family response regulator
MTDIRIIIADDHPLVRSGLREAIEREGDMRVLAEAGDGTEALACISAQRPDVAVLDIEMPGGSGIDVLRSLRGTEHAPRVIMLTVHRSAEVFHMVMELGAFGYVLKESAIIDVVNGIRTVHGGEYFVSPTLADGVFALSKTPAEILLPDLNNLTAAERNVLRLIARGISTQGVAERLFISPRTVTHHRENISSKLGLRGNYALLRFTLEHRSLIIEYLGE